MWLLVFQSARLGQRLVWEILGRRCMVGSCVNLLSDNLMLLFITSGPASCLVL